MNRRVLLKCFVFMCVFVIRPGNVFSDATYYSKGSMKRLRHENNPPAQWALEVIRDKVSLSGMQVTEPGFNLTKEEMIKFKVWPQGIIPYYIDDFSFDKVLRDKIRNYLDLTNTATGLKFTELPRPPADDKTRWVLFVNRQGLLNCADHSVNDFTNEGVQKVILGYDCLVTGGELAEAILALIGVPPQHNAPDRDTYIRIAKKNIIEEKKYLFTPLNNTDWLFHDVPYDFHSASHYGFHKYTKNGYATIKLVKPVNVNFEDDRGFSYNDIWKIRMLYNYISNKKRNSIKISDCMKLFEPGANFTQYKPFLEEAIEPRTKPNKYLGLPDVNYTNPENQTKPIDKSEPKPELDKDDNEDDKENSAKDKSDNEEKKEKAPLKDDKKDSLEDILKKEITSKEINGQLLREESHENHKKENDKQNKFVQLKNVQKRDPFVEMSDYKSSETTKTLERAVRRFKGQYIYPN